MALSPIVLWPTSFGPLSFAYDKSAMPNGPKTIADFFDTSKFPGKRGLRKSPKATLGNGIGCGWCGLLKTSMKFWAQMQA